MIAPSPDAMRHVVKMLENIRQMLEVADVPQDAGMGGRLPDWATPPVAVGYLNVSSAIAAFARHVELAEQPAASVARETGAADA